MNDRRNRRMGLNLHPHAAGHAEQPCHGMLVLPKEKRSSDTAPEPLTFRLLKASDEPSDNASRQRRTQDDAARHRNPSDLR